MMIADSDVHHATLEWNDERGPGGKGSDEGVIYIVRID